MNLESVAQHIETNGLATRGQDLFIGYLPASMSNGILLRHPPGGSPLNWELPGFIKTEFQMIIRSVTYAEGLALARSLSMFLMTSTKYGATIAPVTFRYIRPKMEPFAYPSTPGQMNEFLVNMACCYVDASYSA